MLPIISIVALAGLFELHKAYTYRKHPDLALIELLKPKRTKRGGYVYNPSDEEFLDCLETQTESERMISIRKRGIKYIVYTIIIFAICILLIILTIRFSLPWFND